MKKKSNILKALLDIAVAVMLLFHYHKGNYLTVMTLGTVLCFIKLSILDTRIQELSNKDKDINVTIR